MKKKKLWNILLVVFCLIFFVGLFFMLYKPDNNIDNFYSNSGISSSEELATNPIDFKALKEINQDIYAWIRVPNTNIDYPVAQSTTDDNFYLHHNIYGNYEFAGTIYSEMKTSTDFSDPNTVLYGHNMTKGYMFQNLYKFQDEKFFEENTEIYIYTPDKILTYTIYSAYQYDKRHILNSFDFSDSQVFAEYIESTKNPTFMLKNVRKEIEVTNKDKIITLSTCLGSGKEYRYLVQGVLTDERPCKKN